MRKKELLERYNDLREKYWSLQAQITKLQVQNKVWINGREVPMQDIVKALYEQSNIKYQPEQPAKFVVKNETNKND